MNKNEPKLPQKLDEIGIAISKRQIFDFEKDSFVDIGGYQIDISGSRDALRELGQYLINVSEYISNDERWHEHLENIQSINDHENEIIIRYPYK